MMNFVTGLVGIAGYATFLGILIWWIKELPLIIIMGFVTMLLVWDFILSLRSSDGAD